MVGANNDSGARPEITLTYGVDPEKDNGIKKIFGICEEIDFRPLGPHNLKVYEMFEDRNKIKGSWLLVNDIEYLVSQGYESGYSDTKLLEDICSKPEKTHTAIFWGKYAKQVEFIFLCPKNLL